MTWSPDPVAFLADLEAKPAALRDLAAAIAADPWPVDPAQVRRVVVVGMGSSRFAATAAAGRLRRRGIDAVAEYASAEVGHAGGPGTLAVGISASGSTAETAEALAAYARAGCTAIALTNVPGGPVAAAYREVAMVAGEETGGVACRTYQHTLVRLLQLEAQLIGERSGDVATLARRAADATEDLLARRGDWLPATGDLLTAVRSVFVLAPNERIASAEQGALMFREGPRLQADACETGDWLHVDVYLTEPLDYRALLFSGSRFDPDVMGWMRERAARVVAVGAAAPGEAELAIRYAGDGDPDVALLTEVLVPELAAAEAWRRGRIADMSALVPRREAMRLLQVDRRAIERALARLSSRQLSTPGLGGGEWSPKDLLGHLESWEEHALAALDAWERGAGAPIDRALREDGLTRVNNDEIARKASRSVAKALSSSTATHDELLAAIRAIPDPRWAAPPTRRSRTALGVRLGQFLTGESAPFRHDQAHVASLRAFGAER